MAEEAKLAIEELSDEAALQRPLCVDLDGTLVRTDTLWESLFVLLRARPWLLFVLPLWMLQGRRALQRQVAARMTLDAATLPYRDELVQALRASADKGRLIVLTTSADATVAQAVQQHLGFVGEVVTNDGKPHGALKARFGAAGFDYVGDSEADLPLLAEAQRGYLLGASSSTTGRARAMGDKVRVVSTRGSRIKAAVKVMRVHQWAKNALVVVPVLLAPGVPSVRALINTALAFATLSLCASAGYVFNDLMDVAADRAHQTKRRRPFASGDLPLHYGPPLLGVLLVVAFGVALATLPRAYVGMLALYLVLTVSYSFYLKSKLMIDVLTLAWLYTHRVVAGGIATDVTVSQWLLAFSMFIFFSLAFAKRYIELRASMSKTTTKIHSRGYFTQDIEMVAAMGPAAGFLAVMVFSLYIESADVARIYRHHVVLWFVCPVLLYWISRVWFLAHRGEMKDDPVKFAITDRGSWACAVIIGAIAGVARFWP